MSYGFEIIDSEDQMKNYFKGVSGKHIKDTLFITNYKKYRFERVE